MLASDDCDLDRDGPSASAICGVGQLAHLSARERETAQVAAVLAVRFSGRDLAAALGGHAALIAERVDELICAGVLTDASGRLHFSRPEVREEALSLVPQPRRQAIRTELLRSWSAAGTPPTSELGDLAMSLVQATLVLTAEVERMLLDLVHSLESTDPWRAGRIALLLSSRRGLEDRECLDLHIHGLRLVGLSGRADEAVGIARDERTPADSDLRRQIVSRAFAGAEWAPMEVRLETSGEEIKVYPT